MDYLRVSDLSAPALAEVLQVAARVKARPEEFAGALAGKQVGLFFMKPSTRTRVSSEVAAAQLGARPLTLRNDEVGLGKREAVQDVARTLDRYLDVLALRVFGHADLEVIAQYAEAPVINLLSDVEHPCQAVADLQTIAETRPPAGSVLAYLGDGNNVCHSLMVAAAMSGMEVRVASPPTYEPHADYVSLASGFGPVTVCNEPAAAVKGAHVVYTDVWASMGQEGEAAARRALFEDFRVDATLFSTADPDAVFLHCLPAHRGEEVTDEVLEHPRSRVFDQAENRLHAFKAILLHVAG